MRSETRHKAVLVLGLFLVAAVVACGGGVDRTPNVVATVEARVAQERAKAAEATVTAMVEATVQVILLLPDQDRIAFHSNRDGGNRDIYVMNADGSGQTNLTNNDAKTWIQPGRRNNASGSRGRRCFGLRSHKILPDGTQGDSTLSGGLAHSHEWVRVAEAAAPKPFPPLSPSL